uniref:Mitochondrial S-adenosylmethionine carrier protein n=1 Tax=Amphilophus citrinellus TaxID=61819 RepID=A0A3Q0RPT0_AMPCI
MERREFMASLVAGGCAGMCVDLTLFPLDTIKTRLQSQQGFYKAGGFRGIYAGVPSAAVGSFPSAAAFFVTYEYTKSLLGAGGVFALPHVAPVTHMLAASLGEVVSLPVPHSLIFSKTPLSTHRPTLSHLKEVNSVTQYFFIFYFVTNTRAVI